jgi:micrococcal nuclease
MLKSFPPRIWLKIFGSILLASCQASVAPPSFQIFQIGRVLSGQSVELVDRSQQPPVIQAGRLIGIDAPDLAQEPWGRAAKQRLESSIGMPAQDRVNVEFEGVEADKFGRKFVHLWKDGRLLNEELVKNGYVLASKNSLSPIGGNKYRDRLSRASQYARITGQGIWNPDAPMRMPPNEFRKEER